MTNNNTESTISMINLQQQYAQQQTEINQAVAQVLHRGDFINGLEVKVFEAELAKYTKANNVIACANGTDALQLALMVLGIGPGHEVIIPAFAYVSVAEVVVLLGATPVFVDIENEYFFIDVTKIKQAITPNTKAIIAVHLFGQTGNLVALMDIAVEHNLFIIEDNAQALGASYTFNNETNFLGNWGHIGCTSFFPTKNLGCFGDGGAVFTNDKFLERKIRMIASHGQSVKYQHDLVGINSRLDTLQAAILNVRLKYLTEQQNQKTEIYQYYSQQLAGVEEIILPKTNPNGHPAWHQFTLQVKNGKRDALKSFLSKKQIPSMVYYHIPLPAQAAYKKVGYKPENFPIAQQCASSVLSLPMHPTLSKPQMDNIINGIKAFYYG